MIQHQETASAAAASTATALKLSPPVAVLSAKFIGIPVANWIEWLTLIYLFLMVSHKAWTMGLEFWNYWKAKKAGPA